MKATDYLWFEESCRISEAYCLTLVEGLGAAEALERIDAKQVGRAAGLEEFVDSSQYEFDTLTFSIGATEVGDWTMLVEKNGYLGVTEKVIEPLSTGTQVVSHFCNVNALDRFCWMVDGDLRLYFEPLFPDVRSGSDPDGQIDAMLAAGFDLSDSDDENHDYILHTAATFALAERLTGVRVTAELLETADYLCGLAPLKR
jgi:hypothetical protein